MPPDLLEEVKVEVELEPEVKDPLKGSFKSRLGLCFGGYSNFDLGQIMILGYVLACVAVVVLFFANLVVSFCLLL